MTTPKKRLDATIASLAARVDVSPKHPTPSRPLVRTPKHSKTSVVTPNSKRALACDRSQDLYKRICKSLIDSSRTPPNKKVLTPSKFFKSRTAATPKNSVKRVPFYFCDAPVEYIKDVENMNKVGGRNRKRPSVAVDVVIPLDNIKTGVGAQDYVEVMTDIVEEIFDEVIKGNDKSHKVRTVINKKIDDHGVLNKPSTRSSKSCEYEEPPIYSFERNDEETTEINTIAKTVLKKSESVIKVPAAGTMKRKGSMLETHPSKKRKPVVYNDADSSDEDDAMFISTVKPILSDEEKKEMQKILGKSGDNLEDRTDIDTSKENIGVKRKRKEGTL